MDGVHLKGAPTEKMHEKVERADHSSHTQAGIISMCITESTSIATHLGYRLTIHSNPLSQTGLLRQLHHDVSMLITRSDVPSFSTKNFVIPTLS